MQIPPLFAVTILQHLAKKLLRTEPKLQTYEVEKVGKILYFRKTYFICANVAWRVTDRKKTRRETFLQIGF